MSDWAMDWVDVIWQLTGKVFGKRNRAVPRFMRKSWSGMCMRKWHIGEDGHSNLRFFGEKGLVVGLEQTQCIVAHEQHQRGGSCGQVRSATTRQTEVHVTTCSTGAHLCRAGRYAED